MAKVRLAIPSEGEGGLDGKRSGSFGRCDVFTLLDIEDGRIVGTRLLPNGPGERGGCPVQVNRMRGEGVTAVVAAGIGIGPLKGLRALGIPVYYDALTLDVRPVVEAYLAGELPEITEDQICEGHGNCPVTRPPTD